MYRWLPKRPARQSHQRWWDRQAGLFEILNNTLGCTFAFASWFVSSDQHGENATLLTIKKKILETPTATITGMAMLKSQLTANKSDIRTWAPFFLSFRRSFVWIALYALCETGKLYSQIEVPFLLSHHHTDKLPNNLWDWFCLFYQLQSRR